MKKLSLLTLSLFISVLGILLLLLHSSYLNPVVTYTIVFIAASIVYCGICWILEFVDVPRRFLFLTIAAALLIRLSFISSAPIGSDDIFRYMWDGKVQSAGFNPYLFAPDSSALGHLHSRLLPLSVNHPDMKSPYFPLSEWYFCISYQLSGEAVWGYKLLLFLAEVATIAGLFLLLTALEIPNKYVLLYALCPLAIIEFGLDGHVDALGFPFLMFGLLAHFRGKRLASLVLMALSISIKPVAIVILPIFLLSEQTWKGRIQVIAVPAATIALQYFPYVLSSNPFEALLVFAKNWSFNGVMFESLYLFLANNQTSRLICAILLAIVLLILYLSRKNTFDKIYFSMLLLLLFSPVVHPWYVAWLIILLPLTNRWSGIIFAATASLTSVTILQYKLYGLWGQPAFILILEYLPVIVFLGWELAHAESSPEIA